MKNKILIAVALLVTIQATAQLNIFRGAGFQISYPNSFKTFGSQKSTQSNGLESAFFPSPDNQVEFYIFSAQTMGIANDIAVKPNEKQGPIETQKGGTKQIKYWTITAKDASYERTYQETLDANTGEHWIIGLKYKNQAAFNKYKSDYLAFKKSYRKTGNTVGTSISNNTINAKFSFEELAEDASGIVKSIVYVEYNNNKIKLDTIHGTASTLEKSTYLTRKIPRTVLDACGAWYGGGGTYYYLIQKGTKLQIFRAYADEEAPQSPWEKIKEL